MPYLCLRAEGGDGLSEQFIINGLEILLEILQIPPDPRMQELEQLRVRT